MSRPAIKKPLWWLLLAFTAGFAALSTTLVVVFASVVQDPGIPLMLSNIWAAILLLWVGIIGLRIVDEPATRRRAIEKFTSDLEALNPSVTKSPFYSELKTAALAGVQIGDKK